jgi:hypothetical protein
VAAREKRVDGVDHRESIEIAWTAREHGRQ